MSRARLVKIEEDDGVVIGGLLPPGPVPGVSIAPEDDSSEEAAADNDSCYWDADCEFGVHCEHFHGSGGRCCECGAVRR